MYFTLKALHIIFIVTWFAGLFYFPRLLIYHREAQEKSAVENEILSKQFLIMMQRLLFGITWPSMVLTLVLGTSLAWILQPFSGWFYIKMGFMVCLIAYHISLQRIFNQHKKGIFQYTSQQLRIWNEVPTLLLFAMVFLVVAKNNTDWMYAIMGFFGLIALLMAGINIYKKYRKR